MLVVLDEAPAKALRQRQNLPGISNLFSNGKHAYQLRRQKSRNFLERLGQAQTCFQLGCQQEKAGTELLVAEPGKLHNRGFGTVAICETGLQ